MALIILDKYSHVLLEIEIIWTLEVSGFSIFRELTALLPTTEHSAFVPQGLGWHGSPAEIIDGWIRLGGLGLDGLWDWNLEQNYDNKILKSHKKSSADFENLYYEMSISISTKKIKVAFGVQDIN